MKKDLIKSAKASFEDYFCEYYSINKNVKSVNYYDMKRGNGCYAIVEYRGFLQYIAFSAPAGEDHALFPEKHQTIPVQLRL